jgi:acylglycerol lipase
MTRTLLGLLFCALTGCATLNQPQCDLGGLRPLPACHEASPTVWESFDGTRLPYHVWTPRTGARPKAAVILVPGMDSTTCDYDSLAMGLARRGYIVYGSELRAQRYDPVESRRGNPESWVAWTNDLQAFSRFVHRRHPGTPVYYHGHSLGGVIVLGTLAVQPGSPWVKGVILHAPGFPFMATEKNTGRGAVLRGLSWLRFPHRRMIESDDMPLTDDPDFNCRWLHSVDRLAAGYKLRFIVKATELGYEARRYARQVEVPMFVLEGGDDRVVAANDEERRAYRAFLHDELCDGHAEVVTFERGAHLLTKGSTERAAITATGKWLDRQTR